MNKPTNAIILSMLVLALGASACGDAEDASASYDTPTQGDYDDMAMAVGGLVASDGGGEVRSMEDSVSLALGTTPFGLNLEGELVLGERAGLSYSYMLDCEDAQGGEVACGAGADSAVVQLDWRGDLNLPRYQASVDREGVWALSELQTETPRFDGEGSFVVETHFMSMDGSRQRHFFLDYSSRYDAIVWDRETHHPTQGSIRYTLIAERDATGDETVSDGRFKVDVAVVFTSEGNAMVTLDNQASYWLNLDTGALEPM